MNVPRGHCECVIWRDGERRCELWSVGGVGRLRVFDGSDLLHDEPMLKGYGYSRAEALRNIFTVVGGLDVEPRPKRP